MIVKTYKVIQWATGVVGSASLKGIIRHPRLELVGVKVYSDEKAGRLQVRWEELEVALREEVVHGQRLLRSADHADIVFAVEIEVVPHMPMAPGLEQEADRQGVRP